MSVKAIEKREDVPNPKNEPTDIPYADEKNKRYKLGTEKQIRAAWSYIHQEDNASKYSSEDVKTIKNRIVKYWKLKIDKAGPPAAQATYWRTVEGQFSFGLDASAPPEIMYMPAGDHTIEAKVGKDRKILDVNVTAKTAAKLQNDLDELLAQNVEPFIDFDHEGKAAAAIPKRFKWVQGKGVYLELEWTKSGRERVEGKDYRYFSPTFRIGDDGSPSGLPENGAIGALCNNPAFRDMQRIAASRTKQNGDDADQTPNTMSDKMKSTLMKLGIISDDDNEEDYADKLTKKVKAWQDMEDDKSKTNAKASKGAENEMEKMKKDKEDAEAALAKMVEERATETVDAAITAGKIPGKNEELKQFYVESFKVNPEGTKKALAALPARGVFAPIVVPDGRDRPTGDSSVAASKTASPERQSVIAQRGIIEKVKAAHPNANKDTVFSIAAQEYPEFFANG